MVPWPFLNCRENLMPPVEGSQKSVLILILKQVSMDTKLRPCNRNHKHYTYLRNSHKQVAQTFFSLQIWSIPHGWYKNVAYFFLALTVFEISGSGLTMVQIQIDLDYPVQDWFWSGLILILIEPDPNPICDLTPNNACDQK